MRTFGLLLLLTLLLSPLLAAERPNILFIFSDDHAVNAISAYGGSLAEVAPTPHIDRLAKEGVLFENSFCANSICGPSRATILTGKHSHKNRFFANGGWKRGTQFFDQWTIGEALQKSGYATAVIGKWHLPQQPVGFDYWEILPGQGNYYNPVFMHMDGTKPRETGYATDLTTDKAIAWLDKRDKDKPFFLMCQHKAPHRTFSPALRHLGAFDGITIPEPPTLFDDYANRSALLADNEMEIDRHFDWAYDAKVRKDEQNGVELPKPNRYGTVEYSRMNEAQKQTWDAHFGPENQAFLKRVKAGIPNKEIVQWKYQRYMKNYLGTVKAVDESVGRLTKYIDDNKLADNTLVIYCSDQGFFLGEHGWYDKRWMFEESFKMPFVARWPGVVKAGSRPKTLIQNIDYAPTWAEIAGIDVPKEVQGLSLLPILKGGGPNLRDAVYYAYYEVGEHNVPQHFGVRTQQHKLMFFPDTAEWNLFDLKSDPQEMQNIHADDAHADVRTAMTERYHELRKHYDAPGYSEEPFAMLSTKKRRGIVPKAK